MITWVRPLAFLAALLIVVSMNGPWLPSGYLLLAAIWTRRELRKGHLRRPFMHSVIGILAGFVLWPVLAALSLYEQGSLWWSRGRYMVTDRNGNVRIFRWKADALAFATQEANGGAPAAVLDIFGHM